MTFEVSWASAATRDMAQLPERFALAVAEYVEHRLAENPLKLSKALSGRLDGIRSARNGAYRVLFELDETTETLLVVRIDHRKDVYR